MLPHTRKDNESIWCKPNYMDISNFPTSYYNPCQQDKWNVVYVVCDTTSGKSSLWVNHGKIRNFACRYP